MSTPRVLAESRLSLGQAAARLKVPHSTIYRWASKGVGGVRLETARIGGKKVTSAEAVDRFVAATNPEQPSAPQDRTVYERARANRAAEEQLQAAGWM